MKNLLLVLFLIILSSCVFSTQTITDINTNSPISLNNILTITGTYCDTDLNTSIYCKFLIRDSDGLVVERLTDEKTFANGDFYAERTLNEPLYKRGQDYNVTVGCSNATSSTVFNVGQRESIGHTAEYETRFAFERGNLDSILFFGSLFLVIIIIFSVFIFWVKRAKGLWG